MSSFHTPVLPAKLNLDLESLSGGGSCPSQFWGETHDGHEVYVRYRGGRLRVNIAKWVTTEAHGDDTKVLEADIGPAHDGAMSLHQFCSTFGVTVNGSVPPETDMLAERYTDWSGATTYWACHLERVTDVTARRIMAACHRALPDAMLVQGSFSDTSKLEKLVEVDAERISSFQAWLVQAATRLWQITSSPDFGVMPKGGQLQIACDYLGWARPEPIYTGGAAQASADLRRPVIAAGDVSAPKDAAIGLHMFKLSAAFATDDRATRSALEALGRIAEGFLPVAEMELVDLRDGTVVGRVTRRVDPQIIQWCHDGPDRWSAVMRDHPNGPWIGVRPVPSV